MASDGSSANPSPNPIEAPSPGNKRSRSSTSLGPNEPKQPRSDKYHQSLGKEIGMEDKRPDETKEEMHKTTPTNQLPEVKEENLECNESQGEKREGKKKADRENEEEKVKVVKALPAVNQEQEGGNNESALSTGAPVSFLVELIVKSAMTNGSPLHTLETGAYPIYRYLNPDVRLPCISELKKDFIRVHQEEKSRLKKILKKQRVCLSTETWVDEHGHDYHMSIRAHWINEKWELCNKVLTFSRVPDPVIEESKDAVEELSEIWKKCLKDWDIESVLTVTVGKTYTEDGAVEYLKNRTSDKIGMVLGNEFLHVRSCAHVISEAVKVVLEAEKETIHKIRGTVSFVGFFGERYEHFKECAKRENLEHQGRLFVNKERMWDSTYMMLEKATKLQKAFERLMKEDSLYLSCFNPPFYPPGEDDEDYDSRGNKIEKIVLTQPPSEADWENARRVAKILRLFYKAMRRLSSPLCTTSNFLLEEILGMHTRLAQLSGDEDRVLGSLAERMKKKFDEYWGDLFSLNPLFYIAQVLDPRKKLKYIRFFLGEIGFERSVIERVVERVEATLIRLFKQYLEFEPEESSSGSDLGLVYPYKDEDYSERLMLQFSKLVAKERKAERLLELNLYLTANCETADGLFDILDWWKTNCPAYPVLSEIARDVFAIPATASFYEHAFSKDFRKLVWHKSRLSGKLRETLICGQDWFMYKPPPADFKEAVIDEMALDDEEELADDF